jgi:hypothetical protein
MTLPPAADFLLGLFFDPEDGNHTSLRNNGPLLNYMALQHKNHSFS